MTQVVFLKCSSCIHLLHLEVSAICSPTVPQQRLTLILASPWPWRSRLEGVIPSKLSEWFTNQQGGVKSNQRSIRQKVMMENHKSVDPRSKLDGFSPGVWLQNEKASKSIHNRYVANLSSLAGISSNFSGPSFTQRKLKKKTKIEFHNDVAELSPLPKIVKKNEVISVGYITNDTCLSESHDVFPNFTLLNCF